MPPGQEKQVLKGSSAGAVYRVVDKAALSNSNNEIVLVVKLELVIFRKVAGAVWRQISFVCDRLNTSCVDYAKPGDIIGLGYIFAGDFCYAQRK